MLRILCVIPKLASHGGVANITARQKECQAVVHLESFSMNGFRSLTEVKNIPIVSAMRSHAI
jgi:hypothetical protein